MLRYGRPQVNPDRRICMNCQHFCVDIDPKSGWGICNIGLHGKLFRNHTKHGVYMARHTNSRYYTQTACKVRFKGVNE
jgi:hypothetical protein